jgi:hypothetical protein
VTYAADAFFDFDKSVLKPEGKAKLDDLVGKVKGINLEVIIAVGHTDSVGGDAYNQKLSVAVLKPSRLIWCPRASKRTASTPKARARSSPWPTTRPPKAAPRTVAWKSKWSAPAPTSNPFPDGSKEKTPLWRGFFFMRPRSAENNPAMTTTTNVDPAELAKFSDLAHRWWDQDSEFRPLHQINPLRLDWINGLCPAAGKRVLDVGCGGGILADAMARRGAEVLGIDLATKSLRVAQLHALEGQTPNVQYREVSAEALAAEQPGQL